MEDDDNKVARSPQFPFISLEKAVARAKEFEAAFGQNSGRPASVAKTWGYSEKASGGIQTMAALYAYGLLNDEGSGASRKLRLSQLALTILKDKRPSNAEKALQQAALKPRVLNELWSEWGTSRPPDHECLSILHLDKKFREDAAERLLKIYDSTIRYAGLASSTPNADNPDINGEVSGEVFEEPEKVLPPPPPPPANSPGKVPLMSGERVVFAHELRPNQGFRIVVTGDVDAAMLKALEGFAKFQASLLPEPTKTVDPKPLV